MGRKTKDRRREFQPKPQRSQDTDPADALLKKYTELADCVLESDDGKGSDDSGPEPQDNSG